MKLKNKTWEQTRPDLPRKQRSQPNPPFCDSPASLSSRREHALLKALEAFAVICNASELSDQRAGISLWLEKLHASWGLFVLFYFFPLPPPQLNKQKQINSVLAGTRTLLPFIWLSGTLATRLCFVSGLPSQKTSRKEGKMGCGNQQFNFQKTTQSAEVAFGSILSRRCAKRS